MRSSGKRSPTPRSASCASPGASSPEPSRRSNGASSTARAFRSSFRLHRDPPDIENSERHYHQGLALAAELHMRPLVAHCHLGLGRLYWRTGKRDRAQEHLTIATTMYREMDMR